MIRYQIQEAEAGAVLDNDSAFKPVPFSDLYTSRMNANGAKGALAAKNSNKVYRVAEVHVTEVAETTPAETAPQQPVKFKDNRRAHQKARKFQKRKARPRRLTDGEFAAKLWLAGEPLFVIDAKIAKRNQPKVPSSQPIAQALPEAA